MSTFREEIHVAGRDLKKTIEQLLNDATVDRFKIVNKKTGKVLFETPAIVGIPALLLFNIWSVIGVAIMYVADYTIVIERSAPVAEAEPIVTPPPAEESSAESEPDIADDIQVGETVDVVAEATVDPFAEVQAEIVAEPDFDRCQGTTKAGSQCKRSPMEDSAFCYAHQPS